MVTHSWVMEFLGVDEVHDSQEELSTLRFYLF